MTQRTTTEHLVTEPSTAGPGDDHRADIRRDSILDPGDSHDKGEQSLCVGEAA